MHIGLNAISGGFSAYRHSVISPGVARRLGETVSVGLRFNYHRLKIAGYGQATAVTADVGLMCHLSSRLHFGVQLNNPAGSREERGLPVPPVYSCGLGYEPSETLLFSIEVMKQQSQPAEARLGMQYEMGKLVLLRLMTQTTEPSLWFGAGFRRGQYRLDVYSNYHLQLGMGMGLVMYWSFGES